jgi:hypothetical protein
MLKHVEKIIGLEAPDPKGFFFGVFRNNFSIELIELDEIGPLKDKTLK